MSRSNQGNGAKPMKQFASILAIGFFNTVNANAGEQLGTNGVQNPQARVFFYSTRRGSFTKYSSGRPTAGAVRPVVPSAVIDSERAFFYGTGDGSAGGWNALLILAIRLKQSRRGFLRASLRGDAACWLFSAKGCNKF
jgi:hypothetical protein